MPHCKPSHKSNNPRPAFRQAGGYCFLRSRPAVRLTGSNRLSFVLITIQSKRPAPAQFQNHARHLQAGGKISLRNLPGGAGYFDSVPAHILSSVVIVNFHLRFLHVVKSSTILDFTTQNRAKSVKGQKGRCYPPFSPLFQFLFFAFTL